MHPSPENQPPLDRYCDLLDDYHKGIWPPKHQEEAGRLYAMLKPDEINALLAYHRKWQEIRAQERQAERAEQEEIAAARLRLMRN